MRISDWSSDVCSSDLPVDPMGVTWARYRCANPWHKGFHGLSRVRICRAFTESSQNETLRTCRLCRRRAAAGRLCRLYGHGTRSEEHTSELQSLMRISYAVFCCRTKTNTYDHRQ